MSKESLPMPDHAVITAADEALAIYDEVGVVCDDATDAESCVPAYALAIFAGYRALSLAHAGLQAEYGALRARVERFDRACKMLLAAKVLGSPMAEHAKERDDALRALLAAPEGE